MKKIKKVNESINNVQALKNKKMKTKKANKGKLILALFMALMAMGVNGYAHLKKADSYYFVNRGSDKSNLDWEYFGTEAPESVDCETNTNNWCSGTGASPSATTITPQSEGNYIGL